MINHFRLPVIVFLLAGSSCEKGNHSQPPPAPPPDSTLQCSSLATETMWAQEGLEDGESRLSQAEVWAAVRATTPTGVYPVGIQWGAMWLVVANLAEGLGQFEDGDLLKFCRGFAQEATGLVLAMAALGLPADPSPRRLLSDYFPPAPDPDTEETEQGSDEEHFVTTDGQKRYRIIVERKTPRSPVATVLADQHLLYGTATTPAGTFQALAQLTVTGVSGAAATATGDTLIGISVSLTEASDIPQRLYLVRPRRAARKADQIVYDQVAEGSYAGDTTTVHNGVYQWFVSIQLGESIFLATAVTRNTYRLIPEIPAVEPVPGSASAPLRLVRFGVQGDKVVQTTDCGSFDPDRPYRIMHRGSEPLPQPPAGDPVCTDLASLQGVLTGLSMALSSDRPVSFARYWRNADIGSYINYAYLGSPPPSQPCVVDPPIVDLGTATCPLPTPVYRPRAPLSIYPQASAILLAMTGINCFLPPCDFGDIIDYDESIPDMAMRSWIYWYALDYRSRPFHWMNCAYHPAIEVDLTEYGYFEFGHNSPSFYQMFAGCAVGWSVADGGL